MPRLYGFLLMYNEKPASGTLTLYTYSFKLPGVLTKCVKVAFDEDQIWLVPMQFALSRVML